MLIGLVSPGQQDGSFSPEEIARIAAYWSEPGRYEIAPPAHAATKGPWQVRLTPEGSKWLWDYYKARGLGKVPPSQVPAARNPEERVWESWIESRIAYDRWLAAAKAFEQNRKSVKDLADPGTEPQKPGQIPESLRSLLREPPSFAAAVEPKQHTIRFEDAVISLADNPNMRPRYAYYRFAEGVMSGGTPVRSLPERELSKLFEKAGVGESAQNVMKAVSLLEGGFDAVNTYDTGFVSVGFIQFACLKEGGGSLGAMLQAYKANWPDEFRRDFRRFGIDVSADGLLVAVDPITATVKKGTEAAAAIIRDKRLISVFQRAGRVSESYRVAQIQTAYKLYYPGNELVTISVGERRLSGRVSDIVRSEAGLATLMDRRVNTGNTEPLTPILAEIAAANNIPSFYDFWQFERDILAALRYRKDYLADPSLTQPGPQVHPKRSYLPSRHKARGGRGR